MKVLVACEYSGIVREAFRALGHDAVSCDLLPTEQAGPHHVGDVLPLLAQPWDLVVAFPPCTDLAVSGAAHFAAKRADGRQQASVDFFMQFTKLTCPYAIENPVGIMSKLWRKPDQIINPWQFGQSVSKKTCLWLNKLPPLVPTNIVEPSKYITAPSGRRYPEWCWNTGGGSGKKRSKFFQGIADAMAAQWSAALTGGCP